MTTFFSFGTVQPAMPLKPGMPFSVQAADQFVRYVFSGDPGINILSFNPEQLGPYAGRWKEMAEHFVEDAKVGRFLQKNGKLIIMQGTADMVVSPRATEELYAHFQQTLGKDTVSRGVRYYEVPGFAHTTSATFNIAWDPMSAIEGWVERGVDPADRLVATDKSGVPGRTRPLCQYPTWPRYKGGDVNSAASYVCSAQ